MQFRICDNCEQDQPLTRFQHMMNHCDDCFSAWDKASSKAPKSGKGNPVIVCPECQQRKAKKQFYSKTNGLWHFMCRQCRGKKFNGQTK